MVKGDYKENNAYEDNNDYEEVNDREYQEIKGGKMGYDDYKKHKVNLENEYLEIFNKVEIYINNSTKLDSTEKNNCFLQILDGFLCAQKEGKEIEQITGKDLKKYCDNMVYGEGLAVYKGLKIYDLIMGVIFYITWIQLFTRFALTEFLGRPNTLLDPMIFGLGEIILGISYVFIPIIKSEITKKYFENPKKCKRINGVIYNVMSILAMCIYTYIEQDFGNYGITISYVVIIIILIYLVLIRSTIALGIKRTNNTEFKEKYNMKLNKEYKSHIVKFENNNKQYKTWNEFLIKKNKGEKIFKVISVVYTVVFLLLMLIIGILMIKENKLHTFGIIAIVGMWFIEIILMNVVTKENCLGEKIRE